MGQRRVLIKQNFSRLSSWSGAIWQIALIRGSNDGRSSGLLLARHKLNGRLVNSKPGDRRRHFIAPLSSGTYCLATNHFNEPAPACPSVHRCLSLYLLVRLSTCLPVCLTSCLPVWPAVCLSDHLLACLPTCLSVWPPFSLSIYPPVCLSDHFLACLPICLPVWPPSCLYIYPPVCLSKHLLACLPICLPVWPPSCLYSIYPSVCLSDHLLAYLPTCRFVWPPPCLSAHLFACILAVLTTDYIIARATFKQKVRQASFAWTSPKSGYIFFQLWKQNQELLCQRQLIGFTWRPSISLIQTSTKAKLNSWRRHKVSLLKYTYYA